MNAPGAPGIRPTWTSSAKDMVGTALGPSRLWFTIGYGIALPQLSADGNRLAFTAESQLVPHNNQVGKDTVVADLSLGRLGSACISASGSYGRFGCDGVTISADGKWAAFRSVSDNLVPNDTNTEPDIFVVALDPAVNVVFADGFEP